MKAYQYCLSIDKRDGLPRLTADKMSGNEQDRLTDELTLSAAWVRAAHAMSGLAAAKDLPGRERRRGSTAAADLAAIASGASTPEQTSATLNLLMTSPYLTPWGLRSKPSTVPDYDPTSYAKGSVWGHASAAATDMMWQAYRSEAANALWRGLVPWIQPIHLAIFMN